MATRKVGIGCPQFSRGHHSPDAVEAGKVPQNDPDLWNVLFDCLI